jgi:hypothetical protein
MLRQPAGIVIGFPSGAEAIEGGYRPDPTCRPDEPHVEYSRVRVEIRPQSSGSSSGGVTTVNRGRSAQRIVLADNVSTVLLPPNWRRTQSGRRTVAGYSSLGDTLQPLNGRGAIRFNFVTAPGGVNAEPFLTPTAFRAGFNSLNRQGGATAQANNIMNNVTLSAGRVGGLSGVALRPRPGVRIPELSDRTTIVGRGSKIYVIEQQTTAPGAQVILRSFQPR